MVFGRGMSPVATLVERATRFLMLVALPDGHRAELVADALAAKIPTLPAALARTLTWDQGHENTNGLFRQYIPRSVNMRDYTQTQFDAIADELNGRPRQTLRFATPSGQLARLLR